MYKVQITQQKNIPCAPLSRFLGQALGGAVVPQAALGEGADLGVPSRMATRPLRLCTQHNRTQTTRHDETHTAASHSAAHRPCASKTTMG